MKLPYFKFFPAEWAAGDISFAPLPIQGAFINICGYYWQRDCKLTMPKLQQRFPNLPDKILNDLLHEYRVLKIKNDRIIIEFLDEQFGLRVDEVETKSRAGQLGAKARWKPTPEEINLKVKKFTADAFAYKDKYHEKMITAFIDYWTEMNPNGKLMRYEKETVFDISRRLGTWERNENKFNKKKNDTDY